MNFGVEITPIAKEHLDNAFKYYESLDQPNVVDDFLDDFMISIDELSLNPFFQFRAKEYRAVPMNKFPYLIFFDIYEEEKIVKIIAVFNTYQNPEKYP